MPDLSDLVGKVESKLSRAFEETLKKFKKDGGIIWNSDSPLQAGLKPKLWAEGLLDGRAGFPVGKTNVYQYGGEEHGFYWAPHSLDQGKGKGAEKGKDPYLKT